MSSDIQVFVRWKEQTIFAGEDVECTITFKNVAPDEADIPKHSRTGSRPVNAVVQGTKYSPAKSFNPFAFTGTRRAASSRQPFEKTHRHSASTSLASPQAVSHSFPPATPNSNGPPGSGHRHKRSVSILSLEHEPTSDRKPWTAPFSPKHGRGHTRSASVQMAPRQNEGYRNGITCRV
jgi:hypothetical protein